MLIFSGPVLDELRRFELYADSVVETDLAEWKKSDRSERFYNTANCVECYACHSMCPHVGDDGHPGAYVFVKLAQMHYHPQNTRDRVQQAQDAGLEQCIDCRLCYCPYGVKIQQNVIGEFLEKTGRDRSKPG